LPRESPIPGFHTTQVLQEYGIDRKRVEELLKKNVVIDTSRQSRM